jgi:hypothetical protein
MRADWFVTYVLRARAHLETMSYAGRGNLRCARMRAIASPLEEAEQLAAAANAR